MLDLMKKEREGGGEGEGERERERQGERERGGKLTRPFAREDDDGEDGVRMPAVMIEEIENSKEGKKDCK